MSLCRGSSPVCPGYTATGQIQPSGTFTFASDAHSIAMTYTGTMEVTYPPACLMGFTCAQLAGIGVGGCRRLGRVLNPSDNCVCTMNGNISVNGQGTYATTGGTITTIATGPAATPSQGEYLAVQGSTLTLHFTHSASTASATYVATKE